MKSLHLLFFSTAMMLTIVSCLQANQVKYQRSKKDLSKLSLATFASGCFWCVEAAFESVKGVEEAVSGYAGGTTENPTYEEVGSHKTGHAETINVYYDSAIVSYETLLGVYFGSQDPTQVNGQGPDEGTPYRSIIFYRNEQEMQ
jgi:peptide-methionine (S)-S-oxide reductase